MKTLNILKSHGSVSGASFVGLLVMGLLSLSSSASGAMVMIDDFGTPDPAQFYFIGVNHPAGTPIVQTGLGGTVGGERQVHVFVDGTPRSQSAHVLTGLDNQLFGRGVLQVATQGNPGSNVTLRYGASDGGGAGGPAAAGGGMLVDLTGGGTNDRLSIDFLSIDSPRWPGLELDIELISTSGGAALFSTVVPETASPVTLNVPFTSFVADPSFSFGSVTKMDYVFNARNLTDIDFELGGIVAVPEPTAAWLLTLGLCGLGCRLLARRRAS